ncbi:MAG: hypothetical protein WC809_04675 [Sinimarinibacterium sp.]|jgi:hypothetical protein
MLKVPGVTAAVIAGLAIQSTVAGPNSSEPRLAYTFVDSQLIAVSNVNLRVVWNVDDPERIDLIQWNPSGLTGSEPNLTNAGSTGTPPCHGGDLEYFGNSWAPPDPPSGKVLIGAGTTGIRERGPDNKIVITSRSTDCPPVSAEVSVSTTYKFWQGGSPVNRMKVTRSFAFDTALDRNFRPFVPRLYPVSTYSQVLHPNADGSILLTKSVGGSACPFGCIVTDWAGDNAVMSWFAIHDPVGGQGMIVRRTPSSFPVALWIDWDGASFTNASSVIALQPAGGFTGEVEEEEFLCFYDSGSWTPSLTLPPGC